MSGVTYERSVLPGGATVTTVRGTQPGPTLALLGGVHGDEDEGVLAVQRVVQELADAPLTGTVRAVAPANPMAWAAASRLSPLDGGNLARSFPGDQDGGPTAALAAGITSDVIAGADLLIDLHSAGVRYAMPLFCGYVRVGAVGERSEELARAFGAPRVWVHTQSAPGRSLSVAAEHEIPAIYAECSGGGGIHSDELDTYVRGVRSVMATVGMLPPSYAVNPTIERRWVFGGGDLDVGAECRHHGFFVQATDPGAVLDKGDEVGSVYGTDGVLLEVIRAPQQGMVMFLRRQARVQVGDVLFSLAELTHP